MADTRGVVRLGMSRNQRPEPRDLQRFLTNYCEYWRSIGLELGLQSPVLDQVASAHPADNRECFRVTLDRWLQVNVGVTWGNLELAITNARRASLGYEPLTAIPTTQPEVVAIQSISQHRQDDNRQVAVVNGAIANQLGLLPSVAHSPSYYNDKPKMWDLIKIVIPKIKPEWKHVAYSMQYGIDDIKGIEKDSSNLAERCERLFENWLASPKGITPKTWHTLLKCIRDVDELAVAAEDIDTELKAKYNS